MWKIKQKPNKNEIKKTKTKKNVEIEKLTGNELTNKFIAFFICSVDFNLNSNKKLLYFAYFCFLWFQFNAKHIQFLTELKLTKRKGNRKELKKRKEEYQKQESLVVIGDVCAFCTASLESKSSCTYSFILVNHMEYVIS